MKRSGSKLLSAPYTIWITIFIVIPMLLVVWFAFTDKSGNFTLENILSVGQYSNVFLRSIWLGAVATGYGDAGHASHVDEFPASHLCLDESLGG